MKKLKLIITTLFILTTTFLYANITVIKVEGVSAYFDLLRLRSATNAQQPPFNDRNSMFEAQQEMSLTFSMATVNVLNGG